MIKGAGSLIQTGFMVLAVIAFSALLITLIISSTGRTIVLAQEESKLFTVNNIYDNTELSLRTFWKITGTQALFALDRESSAWEWPVEEGFVEERLKEITNVLLNREMEIDRAVLKIGQAEPFFHVVDGRVNLSAKHDIIIAYFEVDSRPIMNINISIKSLLKKMIQRGNEFARAEIQLPQYRQSDRKKGYETRIENSFSQGILPIKDDELVVTFLPADAELKAAPDKSGLILHLLQLVKFEEKKANEYYDGVAFVKKPLSLTAKFEKELQVLSCPPESLYSLLSSRDMLCSRGAIYTCGSFIENIGSNQLGFRALVGRYACTGSYFCTASEKDGDPLCCTAFGGTPDRITYERNGVTVTERICRD